MHVCMLFGVGMIAQLAFTLLFVQHIAASFAVRIFERG
jgi:hypothetical protein